MQPDELTTTAQRLLPLFADRYFYTAAIPTYVGGIMAFAWASDDRSLRQNTAEEIAKRFDANPVRARYDNPAIHAASFALPQYVIDAMGEQT